MQNINLKQVVADGVMHCGYSPKVLQGFVALEDLAEIARLVILDPLPHNRARYEVVGQNITQEEIAKLIATVAGKPFIPCVQVNRDQVVSSGLVPTQARGAYYREGLDRMLYYYDTRYTPTLIST